MIGSLIIIFSIVIVHISSPYMKFLYSKERSPWLSLSSGVALSYVFVYLLPKLARMQSERDFILTRIEVLDSTIIWILALSGLLAFYVLGWVSEPSVKTEGINKDRTLILQVLGYGAYYTQLGYLAVDIPLPGWSGILLTIVILSLHIMGLNHGLRHAHPKRFDKLLRWIFSGALFLGWVIHLMVDDLTKRISLWDAFIGGGIILIALNNELRHQSQTSYAALLTGALGTTLAILIVAHFTLGQP